MLPEELHGDGPDPLPRGRRRPEDDPGHLERDVHDLRLPRRKPDPERVPVRLGVVRLAPDRGLEPSHRVGRSARDPVRLRRADRHREDHLGLAERDVAPEHRRAQQRPRAELRGVAPEPPRLIGGEAEPLDREVADP
jgi:hypothetical protein